MKKRVLIVNKFYYNRGGDCVCTLNLEALLKAQGWDVAVYAMKYPENFPNEYDKYFAEEVSFAGGIGAKLAAAKRLLGMGDIKSSFAKILQDFKPDVVHLQNIHSYLSPIVAKMAKDFGAKVVWTLHDYKLLCPSYSCLRDGKPCELCFTDKSQVLKKRCMKGSLVASALAYFEAKRWNRKRLECYTDTFVCPSEFMARKMAQGGFSKDKLHTICNFIDPAKLTVLESMQVDSRESYYLYVGRLSEEKGVATLLNVASQLPYKLKVAGGGSLADEFRAKYKNCAHIEFLGHCSAEEVANLLSTAICLVCPSECYENNPLSVIESLCAGTPVIGANIGGIPELIEDEVSGYVFTSGNKAELGEVVKQAFAKDWDNEVIRRNALERFSSQRHMELLKEVYK